MQLSTTLEVEIVLARTSMRLARSMEVMVAQELSIISQVWLRWNARMQTIILVESSSSEQDQQDWIQVD